MANINPFQPTPREEHYRHAHDIEDADRPLWPIALVIAGIVFVLVLVATI